MNCHLPFGNFSGMDNVTVLQQLVFFMHQSERMMQQRVDQMTRELEIARDRQRLLQRRLDSMQARYDELDATCDSLHAVLDRLIGYSTRETLQEVRYAVHRVHQEQGMLDHIDQLLYESDEDIDFLMTSELIDLTEED